MTGLVWFALTLSWVTLFGYVTWVLLAAVLALYIGGFAAVLQWLSRRYPGWDLLLVPLVWTAVEVARSTGPLAFPWALLGVSQHRILPVLQLAAVGGVYLLSMMIALGNAWVVTLLGRPRRAEAAGLILVGLLLVGASAYGARRLQMPLSGSLRLAVLQPNISPFAKGDAATHRAQLEAMERLTREAAAGGADLIVFPETAIPVNLLGPGGVVQEVAAWAPDRIVVASSFEGGADGVRNTAVVLQDGQVRGTYGKRRLVPFGEAGVTPGASG
ncbi:MAG: apolipoprotein N-acyltransferase, partial [Armatimonadetes bacterium]|nr:apolipoprotein N-acyltransferase [Armatimonadota bacterium]